MARMLRKERKDSSMRSLSYFIDVLAIIAFMYILQAQDQAESTEVIISEKEAQIAGYAKEIDIIRKFDPKKTIEEQRKKDQETMRQMEQTLTMVQSLYNKKEKSVQDYQQLVANLHQQSTLEIDTLKNDSNELLTNTVAVMEKDKQEAVEQLELEKTTAIEKLAQEKLEAVNKKEKLLQQIKSDLEQTILENAETQYSLETLLNQTSYERDQLSKKSRERQKQLQSLENQLQSIETEYDESKQENLTNMKQLKRQLGEVSLAKSSLEEENTELETEQSQLEQTRNQLEDLLETLKGSLTQNTRVLEQLGSSNKALRKERDTLQTRGRNLKDQIRELKGKLALSEGKVMDAGQELTDQINQLKSELSKTERELENRSKSLIDLQAQNKKQQKLKDQINELKRELTKTEKDLAERSKTLENLKSQNEKQEDLFSELNDELKDLKDAREQKDRVVSQLKQLEQKGLGVTDDGKLILKLDAKSFAYDSSRIEPPLARLLTRVFPKYASTICENQTDCERISELRISGHASPTFQKRYVDPSDTSAGSRYAHDYNIRLSFDRAQAVFNFIKYEITYPHKKQILKKMTNVSAHGYLKAKVPKELLGQTADCEIQYDCDQEQYVVISFNNTR